MAARLSDAEKEKRPAIRDARATVEQAVKADVNEAETRRRIERTFENVMGYDPFVHLSRERAVRGAGETEHVDFAVQLEAGDNARFPRFRLRTCCRSVPITLRSSRATAAVSADSRKS